jgi:hypothetical protein
MTGRDRKGNRYELPQDNHNSRDPVTGKRPYVRREGKAVTVDKDDSGVLGVIPGKGSCLDEILPYLTRENQGLIPRSDLKVSDLRSMIEKIKQDELDPDKLKGILKRNIQLATSLSETDTEIYVRAAQYVAKEYGLI